MEAVKYDAIKLEIYDRLKWFIKLRWIAIISIFATVLSVKILFRIELVSYALGGILLAMVTYNFIFGRIVNRLHKWQIGTDRAIINLFKFANLQISLDLLFLALLWHLYGGIENPIMFFFIFHMIIASILLPRNNSYFWAILSSLIIIAVALLEYTGIFLHHPVLSKITGIKLYDNLYYIIFILTAFCFSMICVVVMTTSITSRLHRRNRELIMLEKQVADRKLHDTEKKLFFSEKMAALGKLAAGIAHEINNPLTTILSYSECMADELQENRPLLEDVVTIINETIRIREIVKDILNFARASEESEPTNVDINRELSETVKMLQPQMNFINIVFDLQLQEDLPLVKIGKEHLKQVVINILFNSSQAMDSKGSIRIHTYHKKTDDFILIRFEDTGPGIKPEYVDKIFDPYFTTKKQGEGTGLGLAVSYGLIQMYGGDIKVSSKFGIGATFTITLPLNWHGETEVAVNV